MLKKKLLDIGLGTVMALSLLFVCIAANAFSGDATDNAFAALLSMPGAEPAEGFWDFPKPDDLPVANQAALTAYLAKQQKAGADFNAYRHGGTLLHHAIRAGQDRTAIWLLAHGADPRKTLQGGTDTAVTLSANYKRDKVLKVLGSVYGLTTTVIRPAPPKAPVDAARIASLSFGSPSDDKLAREYMRKLAISVSSYNPKTEQLAASEAAIAGWSALAGRLKPEIYARIVDDDQALGNLVLMNSRSAAGLDSALAGVPKPVLQRHAQAALRGLVQRAWVQFPHDASQSPSYGVPPELWRALWRHLPKPMDYAEWPALAGRIQPELWDELFASGYANHDADTALQCLPSDMDAGSFRAAWPLMQKRFANAREAVARTILSPFRLIGSQHPACYAAKDTETRDKLLFLASQGIARPVRGIDRRRLGDSAKVLLPAMDPFIDDTPAGKPRLVDANVNCRFELSDVLYRELLNNTVVKNAADGTMSVRIETVQLVEIPGDADCGLLVGGSSQIGGYVSGAVDTFTGPELNPTPSCPDPSDWYEVWHERGGKIERLNTDLGGEDNVPRLFPVKDTVTGRRYYLHDGGQNGKCHGGHRLPFTFEWKQSPQGLALMKNTASPDLEDALYAQCTFDEKTYVHCDGLPAMNVTAEPSIEPNRNSAFKDMDLQAFFKVFRKTQFDEYQAAVQALDRPRLQQLKTEGVPGPWTAQALKSLAGSALPLADKRHRIAWLFADHAQLARALDGEVLESLAGWLPRKDWGPVWGVVTSDREAYHYGLAYLRANVAEKKNDALACDIDHAQGLTCGETWGVDR